jgi:hypothetical protein
LLLKFFKKTLCKQDKLFYICIPQGRLAQLVQSTWFTPKPPTIQTIFAILYKP